MSQLTKVLIANRGEIAVRIIRAARDEGIGSVAVYAEPDRDALHSRLADEAYSPGRLHRRGVLPGHRQDPRRRQARPAPTPCTRATASWPRTPSSPRHVIDAGLTWIGPPPAAIDQLGDKVQARHLAEKVGAPLVPGTKDPVESTDEVLAFADEHGLPLAIKAAYGGGGRGIKVVRNREEIPELYESAVREAVAAFGRGECFVERFLDAPRHVETQCLADAHGNVVVVSTRDCSLQRRNQKLVEEAPAPFLTEEQNTRLYEASKAIMREAGYVGAGTCEFLVGQDGAISFLEVNTRLQVEHTISEEVTGIDLVREQFRLARGEELGYTDPEVRGHSFEFRINGEDAGRGFMPAPGTITTMNLPTGPGVRIDSGVEAGETVSRELRLDDRQADRHRRHPRSRPLQRARRALAGMPHRGHAHGAAVPPRRGGRSRLHPRRRARSPSTPAGSRPNSPTRSPPGTRPPPAPPARTPDATPSPSRSAASAWRSCCPRPWARSSAAAQRQGAQEEASARAPRRRSAGNRVRTWSPPCRAPS